MIQDNHCTLIAFIDDWLKTKKKLEVKEATYRRLLISFRTLKGSDIASVRLCDLTTRDFQDYVAELIDNAYSLSTIKKQMLLVSAAVRFAYEQRLIDFDPCASVKTPSKSRIKVDTKEVVAFTTEEQEKLRTVLNQHRHNAYYAMELMLETGMRVGEALALSWKDINFEKKSIRIHATMVNPANQKECYVQEGAKSETSNRIIPISPRAMEILQKLRDYSREEWVFSGPRGKRLSYENLRQQCKKVCEEAKVPYYGLHVWRHTFATNLYYKGVDVKILSKLLGHANTTITYNIYVHLYGDGFDDMMNAVS